MDELLAIRLLALLVVVSTAVLIHLFAIRIRSQKKREFGLRRIKTYEALGEQVGKAVEDGRGVHFALGNGALVSPANPTTLSALVALGSLSIDACASDTPPLVSAGDGTLLVAGQQSLQKAYRQTGRSKSYSPSMVRFLADSSNPMAYAAGASTIINQGNLGGNVMMGRFGAEIALIAEAAHREEMDQLIGSDNLAALSVALTVTEDVLIGEELLAAGAYLEDTPAQMASLQLQDIYRYIVAAGIFLAAIFHLIVK